jgi:hypothetical protein
MLLMTATDDTYAAVLASFAEATFYHSPRYLAFLQALLGCRLEFLLGPGGAMPLMSCDGPLGEVVNSLPFFGSYGGILGDPAPILPAYRERIGGTAAATVIESPFAAAPSPDLPTTHHDERIAQFTMLPGFKTRIDGTTRRNIRKAQQSGITVAIEADAMTFLRECHYSGMAEIGGTTKPDAFFALIPEYFRPDDFRIYVARRGGQPIAALLLFYYGRFVEYFTPAILAAERAHQPMAAILAEAMTDAESRGFTIWNWGGTWLSQTGVYRFKRKWAADERRYHYRIAINNPAILQQKAPTLLATYPYFYVAPFNALTSQ